MIADPPVQHFIYNASQLAYRQFGRGPAIMLAFHGFGQDGRVFYPLQHAAGERYTIYALDLFFHGESQLVDNHLLTKTDWQNLMNAFLSCHTIERFTLIGFSLGGRFALITAESFADRLDQLILLAPDGITENFWHWLATSSKPGRWLLKVVFKRLTLLNVLFQVVEKTKLVNSRRVDFVKMSLKSENRRDQVYRAWTTFHLFNPDLMLLEERLTRFPVRLRVFMGNADQVIPVATVYPLLKRLHAYELTVLKAGHYRLIDKVAPLI